MQSTKLMCVQAYAVFQTFMRDQKSKDSQKILGMAQINRSFTSKSQIDKVHISTFFQNDRPKL